MRHFPRIQRKHVLILVAGMAIGALLVGTSMAVTSSKFKYSQTQTGYHFYSPMDFAPDSLRGATDDYFNSWSVSTLSNQEGSRCFNTSVHLPQGAKIKSVKFFYTSDATSDFSGVLMRQHVSNGNSSQLVSVFPLDDSGVRTSVSGSVEASKQSVDNKHFAYGLGACPFLGTTFHGARLKYTYKNAGD